MGLAHHIYLVSTLGRRAIGGGDWFANSSIGIGLENRREAASS